MPGTFNGKTLTISATPTDGAKIPDKNATNVAGIAIVGSDMYCVKTTGLKTTLYKTTNYTSSSAKVTDIKQGLNWFALGLTKIGNYLYMLAEDHKGYGGSTTIVKLDTAGNQISTFSITNICGKSGALGITAADGTNEKFIIMHYAKDSSANTLTFSVVNWGSSKAEKKFTVTNSGYGYTTQLQDIYYHTSYGLFILTNNTFTTLKNRILVVDYKNTDGSGKNYVPSAVIDVKAKGDYKQYNLESICMKANHLVLVSNVVTSSGAAEDRFSVLNGITYDRGMYYFNTGLQEGALVPTKVDPEHATTNLGCMSFKNGVPYFVKQSNDQVAVLGYSPDYFSTVESYKKVKTFVNGTLGHANGMTCYNGKFYIATAVDNKVVALDYNTGALDKVYTIKANGYALRVTALNYFNGECLLMSSNAGGKTMELFICTFGTSTSVDATYIGKINNPLAAKGLDVTQDIFHDSKYGLFVGVCNADLDSRKTTENIMLHYDLSKLNTNTNLNPDFGFVTNMPNNNSVREKYNSYELESMAINKGKMVAVYNTNVSLDSGLAARDRFMIYHTIDFI